MLRTEYKVLTASNAVAADGTSQLEEGLTKLGREGWKIATVLPGDIESWPRVVMERPYFAAEDPDVIVERSESEVNL